MSKKRRQWGIIALIISLIGFSGPVHAVISVAGNLNWTNTAIWFGGVVPVATDPVNIRNGSVITVNSYDPCSYITLGEGLTSTGTVNVVSGGNLAVTSYIQLGRTSVSNARGWLNISGGTVSASNIDIGKTISTVKPSSGYLTISGGTLSASLNVGSATANDTADIVTVIGSSATISGVNLDLYQTATLNFIFDAAGISKMAYSGTFSNYTGSTIIIDGSAYTGGANTFDLITAGTLTAQNSTVILTNFANTATLNWGTEPGIVSVSIIPEPATIGMLGLGTLAIILFRRRMAK